MKNTHPIHHRPRATILSDLMAYEHVALGTITQKRQVYKNGNVGIYHQLQRWENGRNVTTYIPVGKLAQFEEAVRNGDSLTRLLGELSDADCATMTEGGTTLKKKRPPLSSKAVCRSKISCKKPRIRSSKTG